MFCSLWAPQQLLLYITEYCADPVQMGDMECYHDHQADPLLFNQSSSEQMYCKHHFDIDWPINH